MISNIQGSFYDEVLLQIGRKPKIVDVSAAPYEAEAVGVTPAEQAEQSPRPFIIAHPTEVTLKVQHWDGTIIIWTFTAGPYPMPLRKIFNDLANTATSIQIGY